MFKQLPIIFYPLTAIVIVCITKIIDSSQFFSGHAFIFTSLVTIIVIKKGVKSIEFALAFIFSGLYLYDLARLHKIISFGHTSSEIIIGVLGGLLLTILIYSVIEKNESN